MPVHDGASTPAYLFRRAAGHARLLFVLVILAHDRQRVVHVAVTEHPTAAWTAQQLRNAFPDNESPRYLPHDRDSVFAHAVTTMSAMNTQDIRTAPRSTRQNAGWRAVIGSIRRECLDQVIVLNATGLHRGTDSQHRVLHAVADTSEPEDGLTPPRQ